MIKLKCILGFGAATLSAVSATALNAAIDNTATVTGFYGGTDPSNAVSSSDDETVPVAQSEPDLTITKSAGVPTTAEGLAGRTDAGDTITYTFVITNDGNVTMTDVTPVDTGPTFNGETGTGSLSAFTVDGSAPPAATATLAPGESETFTAVYTLSDLDVYHAADTAALVGPAKQLVANTAAARGVTPQAVTYDDPDTAEALTEITPTPDVTLVKAAVLTDGPDGGAGLADVGETITYTYTVTNTGTVPLASVTVADIHEGAALTSGSDITSEALDSEGPLAATTGAVSTDATANDGVWDLLQPEAVVVFTYVHTVTQAEVDGG